MSMESSMNGEEFGGGNSFSGMGNAEFGIAGPPNPNGSFGNKLGTTEEEPPY